MKLLIDMENRSEIGIIDWEFIHDMQGITPQMITSEMILLTEDFLAKVPRKWKDIKEKLGSHVSPGQTIHCAIADIENLGNEFKIRGALHNKNDEPLGFHKIIVYDEDKFEDDYIGTIITDKDGMFSLAFGKKTFSDFGMDAEPDIYFRVYYWKDGKFNIISKVTPSLFEKIVTKEKHTVYDFGIVSV